ncbi:MAG TPA: hypothetical protein VMD75_05875 [Candidatus Binataceae bacterium]|nr:hypothetical protein [Candidatus Binataceae bacterium]
MKPRVLAIGIAIFLFGLSAAVPAGAAEARPWLCRDKPVFSSDHAMRFEAARQDGRWLLLLMTFDAMGGHDGFTIVESQDLSSTVPNRGGQLPAGRYFAVAQYLQGGEWICPGYAQKSPIYKPNQVASICYDEESAGCAVKLIVSPVPSGAGASSNPSTGH